MANIENVDADVDADADTSLMMAAPPVVVAMVVHQPVPWLNETLSALAAQDYPNLQALFFVTLAARDESQGVAAEVSKVIRGHLPNAVIRLVDGNPGFGPLMNEVGRLVEGDGGFFCLMHDDVALETNAISRLIEEMFRSNAGVVGPKLVMWDDPTMLQCVGLGADRIGEIDAIANPGEKDQEQHDAVRDVFLLPSACMLVRSDLFREIGGFSPDITFFGEDLDFCWRAHLSGARVLVVPAARARHRGQVLSRILPSQQMTATTVSALEARHRVRTVATLSSRVQLPIVLLQLLVMAVLRVVIGVFKGTFREAQAALRASLGVVFDIGYIVRRRAEVRPYRRVSASEIHHLQSRGSARLLAYIRSRRSKVQQLSSLGIDNLKNPHSRAIGITALVVIIIVLIGSRGLITGGVSAVGEFLPLRSATESPTALLSSYLSGWWQAGFGQAGASPTGVALLAVAGLGVLGRLGLLQSISTVGAILIGCIGMWHVPSGFFSSRARIVGFVIYAAVPLPYASIAHGRFGVLICYAGLPWMLRFLVRIGQNPVGATNTQLLAATVLFGAVVGAFAPVFVVVVLWTSTAWCVADVVCRVQWRPIVAVGRLMVVFVIGVVVLNFPWSGEFFVQDWWQRIVGAQANQSNHIGITNLARMDGGLRALSVLALGLYVPVLFGLAVVRGEKVVWAMRGASLVLFSIGALALIDGGHIRISVPEYGILLVVVACGLSLAAATLADFAFEQQSQSTYHWWRPLVGIAAVAVLIGVVPVLVQSLNGRWSQPQVSLAQLVVQLPTDPVEGDYNVVFIGRTEVMPLPGTVLTDHNDGPLSFAVADDGELTMRDHWAPPSNALSTALGETLSAVLSQDTVRAGRMMSSMAVRYIVVPIIDGAASTVEHPLAAPTDLLDGLSLQLDFRRVYTASDLVIFENMAYIPALSALDENTSLLSQQAGTGVLLSSQLANTQVLHRDGDVASVSVQIEAGTVHLAAPLSNDLLLTVDGSGIAPRLAFGGTTAFDSPSPGVATLSYVTPWSHIGLMFLQMLLWGIVIVAAFNFQRLKARLGVRRIQPVVLDESADVPLSFVQNAIERDSP